jgi:hypothetical protein
MDLSIYIGKRVISEPAKWAVGRFAASLPLTRSQNPLILPKDYHSYMVFMKEKWNGNGLVDYETAALNLNIKYLKKFVTLVPCLSIP